MNRLTIALIAASLLGIASSALALEDDDAHAGHLPAADAQSEAPATPLAAGFERMRALIAQAQGEQDPVARRQLLDEHVQAMREQVQTMRARAKGPAHDHASADEQGTSSAGEKKGGGMMGKGGMMKGMGGMKGMHERVEQRLDAIEQMLEQLVEREALEL